MSYSHGVCALAVILAALAIYSGRFGCSGVNLAQSQIYLQIEALKACAHLIYMRYMSDYLFSPLKKALGMM
jgi:hypothetical protein